MGGSFIFGVIVCVLFSGATGRPVNISSSWFLPQERYPVFYRYFSDKVTWHEAEAICGFHRADLLSVQTSTQMDATRAYLKEIDVTDNIWIGLKKEGPDKPFTWTNGEKLLDGYWSGPIPKTKEKLCAAIDPIADFRWNSYYCTGPEVAPFVCELPVPDWAKEDDGCMITSLPSLTITFIPDKGVVQLLSDCGLDGTRRIACKGRGNREEMIKRLSCDVDAFASTVLSRSTTDATQHGTWSEMSNQINRHTTKAYTSQTRHKRSINDTTSTTPPSDLSKTHPSYVFPHSPYLASERNGPNTKQPPINPKKPNYEPLPVLVITGEKNESVTNPDGITSEKPEIVLMLNNKDVIVPLADDIIINNPSLAPVELINVDSVQIDNVSSNGTNQTMTVGEETAIETHNTTTKPNDVTEVSLNMVESEEKDPTLPQRPNRARSLTHPEHPSFYPRFLKGVLG